MTDSKTLIERARKNAEALRKGAQRSDDHDAGMLNADADLYDELADEISELREVLKPFAEEAKCWSERMPMVALVVDSFDDEEWNNPSFHVSDLLRARAKLEGSGA